MRQEADRAFLNSLESQSLSSSAPLYISRPSLYLSTLSSSSSSNARAAHSLPETNIPGRSKAMALARLALKNVQQRLGSASSASSLCRAGQIRQGWNGSEETMAMSRRFLATATEKASDDKEVAVSEKGDGRKFRLFPRRNRRRSLWRRNEDADFVPALYEFFPSGLGNALMQATENINRLFENMNISPWQLMGRVKEKDDHYKLRYEVPGLTKDDVKITVHDGILTIKGEHKREEEEGSDDEYWSAATYGYYNTSLVLPEDAKADEIKAELKDGVLNIIIPRTEKPKKDVKEVNVQ